MIDYATYAAAKRRRATWQRFGQCLLGALALSALAVSVSASQWWRLLGP